MEATTYIYWDGFNGKWEKVDDLIVEGMPVFSHEFKGSGPTYYMWWETDYTWPEEGYYGGWGIGLDHKKNEYWGWKWGKNLFSYNRLGTDRWMYYYPRGDRWYYMGLNANIQVTCSSSDISVGGSITIPGVGVDSPDLNGTVVGASTAPYIIDSSSSPFVSTVMGSAIGAVVVVAAVIVVLVKRSRKKTKSDRTQHDGAQHVAEFSPTDIAETIGTVMPAEKQCSDEVPESGTEAVVVMEDAAQKPEDGAVSAE